MGNKTVDKEKYTQKDFAEKIIAVSKNFIAFNVMDYLQELENTQDARLAIVSLIHSKLKQDDKILLTQKDISSVDDEAFEPFILAVLEKDIEVKKIFDEMDCRLPAFERFASAYKQCWEDIFRAKKKLTQSITDNQELAKNTVEITALAVQEIEKKFDTEGWENIQRGVKKFIRFVQRVAEIAEPIVKVMVQYANIFSKIISAINIPDFSEQRKQELLESYKEWGNLGWTMIPHASIEFFDVKPIGAKEADKLALKYFTKQGIEYLFDSLQGKAIKKDDLISAIFCYENRQYKACALMLFGIIDAKLIRSQKRQKSRRREVCSKAVRQLTQKLEKKYNTSSFFYSVLRYYGTTECLNMFFKSGDYFVKEPDVINRNFVGHGMNRRNVRKKDCIQLFLALYNLSELLEDSVLREKINY